MSHGEMIYTGLISVFLLVTLIGFVWSHIVYKKEVEEPKFEPLNIERSKP